MQFQQKSQWYFVTEIGKNITEINMELQKILNNQSNLKKENQSGGITLSDFEISLKCIIKIVCYLYKNRHVGQWNRIPRNKPMLL